MFMFTAHGLVEITSEHSVFGGNDTFPVVINSSAKVSVKDATHIQKKLAGIIKNSYEVGTDK